eukprot:Skav235633  [mRNA]  locus=scaffold358:423522:427481:- [translate_table: standard]
MTDGISLVDFCSGIGGFSIGSQAVGITTVAFVEQNALACSALLGNFAAMVHHGGVQDTRILKKIHAQRPTGSLQVAAGFPCQPYSRQGDMMGMQDQRGGVIHSIFRGAWLLHAQFVLLECVANVIHFQDVQAIIASYAEKMGLRSSKLVFGLKEQWPVRRNRFWCFLSPLELPEVQLEAWPHSPAFQRLGNIMPLDALWDDGEEEELAWDADEACLFSNSEYGSDERLLHAGSQVATMLHSWGNITRACPCQCRGPLSRDRLLQGGARGSGLLSAKTLKPRHFSMEEAKLLSTFPLNFVFKMSSRAALCLLGQVAAPLQVLWVQTVAFGQLGILHQDALDTVHMFKLQLLQQVRQRWITKRMYVPRHLHLESDGAVVAIAVNEPTRVSHVLFAERHLQGWGQLPALSLDGLRLSRETVMHDDVLYQLEFKQPRRLLPCPFPSLTDLVPENVEGFGALDSAHACPGLGDRFIWTCMKQYLKDVSTGLPLHFTVYPFRAQHFLELSLPQAVILDWHQQYAASNGCIVLILAHEAHWFVLHAEHDDGAGLRWTLLDGHAALHPICELTDVAVNVALKFSHIMGAQFHSLVAGCIFGQFLPFTCGTIALAHMAYLVGSHSYDSPMELETHLALLTFQDEYQPIVAFGNDTLQSDSANLLQEKGVPSDHSEERAKQTLAKLGNQQVRQALASKNAWAALKAAANKPGTMFRLVTVEELNRHIANRSRSLHGAVIQNHKQKKLPNQKKPIPMAHVDPSKLQLDSKYFTDDDDQPVPQLQFDEVEAEQRGVALCAVSQAIRFLEHPTSISVEALALILVDHPSEEIIKQAGLQKFAFPAYCPGTNEHTLIFGYILQLGDQKVKRSAVKKIDLPEIVPTCVVKMQVFKDQFSGDWQKFLQAPIKALVFQLEALKLCRGQSCGKDCPRYRPGLDEAVDNVLFEVWARTCYDEKGTRCDATRADSFSVFFRVPDGALSGLLTCQVPGVYTESRGDNPQERDLRYRVIWLPGDGFAEAQHKYRACAKAISLVRLRSKYGIRVAKDDEAAAWAFLRPGMDYVNLSVNKIFELSPVPHGAQRTTVAKLLKEWGWAARPLQPGRGTTTHMSWRVGSDVDPPQMVMQGFECEVVVSPVRSLQPQKPKPSIIASTRTQKHLVQENGSKASSSSGATDPWLSADADPWSQTTNKIPPVANNGKSRLEEIKQQLCQDVTEKVRKELESHASSMEVDAEPDSRQDENEARFKALEVGMTELRQQNTQFLDRFHEAGDRMKSTERTMGEMQQSIAKQQHELHDMKSTVQNPVTNMRNELSEELNQSIIQESDVRIDGAT